VIEEIVGKHSRAHVTSRPDTIAAHSNVVINPSGGA
jgi:hypothetical protein